MNYVNQRNIARVSPNAKSSVDHSLSDVTIVPNSVMGSALRQAAVKKWLPDQRVCPEIPYTRCVCSRKTVGNSVALWTDMPTLNCIIPQSLEIAMDRYIERTKQSASAVVTGALSQFLNHPLHTLFQVSTSGALVRGVYQRSVSVELLKQHGDFGLGTFDDLDGEMAVLEGKVYQTRADGTVHEVPDSVGAPFAVIARFTADAKGAIPHAENLSQIVAQCDRYRGSDNLFFAIRIDGRFDYVHTRAMPATNQPLAQAAAVQPEFRFRQVEGTLVGIWSPAFSSAFSIPGYHFHFLSSDRKKGGHLLECSGRNLAMQVERLSEFHVSLPESEEFLKADLSKDPSAELSFAEGMHKK